MAREFALTNSTLRENTKSSFNKLALTITRPINVELKQGLTMAANYECAVNVLPSLHVAANLAYFALRFASRVEIA